MSFFKNIMGYDTVTIDGHAYNIARYKRVTLTDDDTNISKSVYLEMQEAYQRAAKRVGLKVYQLQAITWVVWKRIHNI
jgi:thermostable 8-oxoguanine DNA glycosylase